MRIHILGICGTFMAGIAVLAKQSGHEVSGSDLNVYPPMSTQLQAQNITLMNGFDPSHIDDSIDCVIVGNVISRGNPLMEAVLDKKIPYISGPQWLAENILQQRWVLAVAGTHGKTTTTSMLTWILEFAGLKPSFLVGGVPENFGVSARVTNGKFFVIEADEYDSAFFDKRSKFIHYRPKTLILNNLEFDHADIFPDLDAIKQQFHYLVRTVPGNGMIIAKADDANLTAVLAKGCWSAQASFGVQGGWQAQALQADGGSFEVMEGATLYGTVNWSLLGKHNVENALAAIAAAKHAGVNPAVAIEALSQFKNVKRRMEIKGTVNGVTVYDDFAHHPTAIATTLAGLRAKIGHDARIIAVLEFGSYTMRTGVHKAQMPAALAAADLVLCKRPDGNDWGLAEVLQNITQPSAMYDNVETLVEQLTKQLQRHDHVIVMSNSGFGGIHDKLLQALNNSLIAEK